MENFKKFKGGPTPVSTTGRPFDKKTTGPPLAHHPHGQDPHQKKRPKQHRDSSNQDKHSPPVVPHHTSNPDWVYASGHPLRIQPQLGPLVKPWAPLNHPMASGQGGQNKVEGTRSARGGEGVRPNPTNTARTIPGKTGIPMQVGMTKKIRGLIGKGKKKMHRSAY